MDTLVNGGYSTVATAPSPATSGLTLVVAAGDGAKFPATGSFDVVLCPVGQLPLFFGTNKNAEIARCTLVSTDTLTIVRAQYGTTAQTVAVGWAVAGVPNPISAWFAIVSAGLPPAAAPVTVAFMLVSPSLAFLIFAGAAFVGATVPA